MAVLSPNAGRVRSWHMVVAGIFVQMGAGAWVLWTGVNPAGDPGGGFLALFVRGALVGLGGIAGLLLLPAVWLLHVGRYRAIAILVVVGVAFLATLRANLAVWPLPAFLTVAAGLAWRKRET